MIKPLRNWHDVLIEDLKNMEEAVVYLQVAIEEYEQDGDKNAFLKALKNVAEAQGGIGALAKRTGLNREHLYKALSDKGNPQLNTVGKILQGLGFRLSIEQARPKNLELR